MAHFNFTMMPKVFVLVILVSITFKKNSLINSQEHEIEDTFQPFENDKYFTRVHELEIILYHVMLIFWSLQS